MQLVGAVLITLALALSYTRWIREDYTWNEPASFLAFVCLVAGIAAVVFGLLWLGFAWHTPPGA